VKKISIVGVLGVGRAHLLSIFMIAANHKQETYLIDLYDEKETRAMRYRNAQYVDFILEQMEHRVKE